MTEAVTIALIAGGFGAINTAITAVGAVISRKARDEAREAKRKVEEVHEQAVTNGAISQANHTELTKVVANTDGNVRKLQEAWAAEARKREEIAWHTAFEAGRRAEMEKKRRATDVLDEPVVNEEEPSE